MESNELNESASTPITPKKKGGRPKGSVNKKKPKKVLQPDPILAEMKAAKKDLGEGEPHEVAPAQEDLRKKYPVAYKWPSMKFYHCMVMRGEGFMVEYDGLSNQQAAPYAKFDRGVGAPVTIVLGKPCVLPDEIVEAIKDTTVDHPIVVGGEINERSNGFNGWEKRSRYKIMIAGPATPEEYEANVLIGKNRKV